MTKMIPPIPTSAVLMPTPKQKIGFSIESIVGNEANASVHTAVGSDNHNTSTSSSSNSNRSNTDVRNHNHSSNQSTVSGPTSPPQTPPTAMGATHLPGAPHLLPPFQIPPTHTAYVHPHTGPLPPHFSPPPHLSQALHQHLLLQQQHQQLQHQEAMSPKAPDMSIAMRHDLEGILKRLKHTANTATNLSINVGPYSPPQTHLPPEETAPPHLKRMRSPLTVAEEQLENPSQRQKQDVDQHVQPQPPHTPPKSVSPISSHPSSPPSLPLPNSPTTPQHQLQFSKHIPSGPGPLMVHGMPPAGLVRPFAVVGPPGVPPPQPPQPPQQGMPDIKALPPYINAPPDLAPQHNPHLMAAAQFQMAAAIQAGHVLGPAAAAAAAAGLPPHAPFMHNPNLSREGYPLYPWLLSRHGRIFPHRFPGNFLLQPFRKPKRIRTAFSPSQLLKLEHAFESNQYVVGAERKALAQSLNLSETQVKVWFQNRRTKHKRMQQEDEKGGNGNGNSHADRNSHHTSCDEEDDDELIDMEMDDCGSDEDHELDANH